MNAKAKSYFRGLLAHVNLKESTENFQSSEVYGVVWERGVGVADLVLTLVGVGVT